MLGAFLRRIQLTRIEAAHNAMVSGIWGNMNYDQKGDDGRKARTALLEAMREEFDARREEVYEPGKRQRLEEAAQRALDEDPFFRSVRRLEKMYAGVQLPRRPGRALPSDEDLDQLDAPGALVS